MGVKDVMRALLLTRPAVALQLARREDRLTVLCFHGVTRHRRLRETANYEGRHVHEENFARILERMLRHFTPISTGEVHDFYYRGARLPQNSLLLTFDDGFANNYHRAFRVLARLGCPAIVFLATGYVGNPAAFWVERLEYAVHNSRAARLTMTIGGREFDLPLGTSGEKETAYMTVLRHLKSGLRFAVIEAAVEDVCDRLGFPGLKRIEDNEDYRFLSWDEVAEMAAAGIEFGAHTVNHVNLANEDGELADWEVRTSKATIERHVGRECVAFCYPFGRSGHSAGVEELVRGAGFKLAFQLGGGVNDRRANPLLLRRIGVAWGSTERDVLWRVLSNR